jgi:hypothetical protein
MSAAERAPTWLSRLRYLRATSMRQLRGTLAQYHNVVQGYKPDLTAASLGATDLGGLDCTRICIDLITVEGRIR